MKRLTFILAIALVSFVWLASAVPVEAATFTVTNTNDSGTGSLRQAILTANTNTGLDVIAFNIPGTGPHTIQPQPFLPSISDPVLIDGYTQPGASPNTNPPGLGSNAVLMIELDGTNAGGGGTGLAIRAGGSGSTVRGLVINRFSNTGILLSQNAANNVIEGNFIGTDVTGTIALSVGVLNTMVRGVFVCNAANNTIGGTTPAARNVIYGQTSVSGNDGAITIFGSGATGNLVQGNLIGTDASGSVALGDFPFGVQIEQGASNNTVGGITPGAGNVISGHRESGVDIGDFMDLGTAGNTVQGNFIGTDVTGAIALGNGTGMCINHSTGNTLTGNTANWNNEYGFYLDYSSNNTLTNNTASNNDSAGIWLFYSNDNTLTANTASNNQGLGIFLGISSGNTLNNNTASNNDEGITLGKSSYNTLTNNTASNNDYTGIHLSVSSDNNTLTGNAANSNGEGIGLNANSSYNTFNNNTASNNDEGIVLYDSIDNTFTNNTVSNNDEGIVLYDSIDNQIYHNNFIENSTQAYVDGGSGNVFNLDKPIGGNYWSDWTTPDADGDGFVDFPYEFTGGIDYLPWAYQDGWVLIPAIIEVAIDIKPQSCPNPLNVKSKGVLPVAILGTEDFDVFGIDVASIRLEGISPIRSAYEDVATPVIDGDECECTTEDPDVYTDLSLKFKTQDIVEALGEVVDGEELVLTLTGVLLDGTPIEGEDCIRVIKKEPLRRRGSRGSRLHPRR